MIRAHAHAQLPVNLKPPRRRHHVDVRWLKRVLLWKHQLSHVHSASVRSTSRNQHVVPRQNVVLVWMGFYAINRLLKELLVLLPESLNCRAFAHLRSQWKSSNWSPFILNLTFLKKLYTRFSYSFALAFSIQQHKVMKQKLLVDVDCRVWRWVWRCLWLWSLLSCCCFASQFRFPILLSVCSVKKTSKLVLVFLSSISILWNDALQALRLQKMTKCHQTAHTTGMFFLYTRKR